MDAPPELFLTQLLEDTSTRVWLPRLPAVFRQRVDQPYTPEEIKAAAEACNSSAKPPEGRAPRLIFELGAAGSGKSTRMADCFGEMGVDESDLVFADGDRVRNAHQGLKEVFALSKMSLLDGMREAGSPELKEYTVTLDGFGDEHPVGFKDSERWSYNASGKHKDQIAQDGVAAHKDVIMGITKHTQLTNKYKAVVDAAVAGGYEISAMVTLVQPEVLARRQCKRPRLVQIHPECLDGNLVSNAALKQAEAIEAIQTLSSLVRQQKGVFAMFDNTPDLASKTGPFWIQRGGEIEITYDGEPTVLGVVGHITKTIQGEISRGDGTRSCSVCGDSKNQEGFSKGQWRKGDQAKCISCVKALVYAPLVAKHQGWSTGKTKRPDQVQGTSKKSKQSE
eukprot:TRINITY_DN2136_c0_g1_i1.p1 TRINITY_DN2136_c0_g1~~TRINITY_DN2136_c0_g1_i1.p1  ORF type:complete len:393 (+),score=90.58 TRINITY_DN2136_c0_g1_i1:26-1204(+)